MGEDADISPTLFLGLVLPLGLDTFAMAAGLGVLGLPASARLRLSLVFAAFEGGMPLVGLVVGVAIGRLLGSAAELVAAAALVGLGLYLVFAGADDDGADEAGRLAGATGLALFGLGLSISLDELAIGFTLGLAGIDILAAVLLIAVQAFLVTQLGLLIGRRVGRRFREAAPRLAGVVLALLGLLIGASRLFGFPGRL